MGKGGERFPMVPSKTAVWLDVDTCEFPDDLVPGRVRLMIESALARKFPAFAFGDREVTIFAIGNLLRIPLRHTKALADSGILMRHSHFDLRDFNTDLQLWRADNPPPAVIMFITQNPKAESRFRNVLSRRIPEERPYTVLPAYPGNPWGWDSLLKETPIGNTPPSLADTTLPRWHCRLCWFDCDSSSDFVDHLYGDDHDSYLAGSTHLPPKDFTMYQDFLRDKRRVLRYLKDLLQSSEFHSSREQSEDNHKQRLKQKKKENHKQRLKQKKKENKKKKKKKKKEKKEKESALVVPNIDNPVPNPDYEAFDAKSLLSVSTHAHGVCEREEQVPKLNV